MKNIILILNEADNTVLAVNREGVPTGLYTEGEGIYINPLASIQDQQDTQTAMFDYESYGVYSEYLADILAN